MLSLANKHILLGICGGIAAYKSAELCRLLIKAGAKVKVAMTESAQEFITPLTLQALSGERVHTSLLDEEAEASMGHIELARWADLVLVAPATANFMAKLANGEASDLLTTLCLATTAPIALAPAMNQAMWLKPVTQNNLEILLGKGVHVFGPDQGEQACGDIGPGRMLEPEAIGLQAAELFQSGALAGLKVTITAGPTREAIDPVRFISNHSSGKMAYSIAQAAVEAGAKVTLISGPVSIPAPEVYEFIKVESAIQMRDTALENIGDIFISVAAVADYRPAATAQQKIKKAAEDMTLKLIKNPDIVSEVAALNNRPFCVGFAAETENHESNAVEKMQRKNLDMVVANDASATFNNDEAGITIYWKEGKQAHPRAKKSIQAKALINTISSRYSLQKT